MGKRFKKIHGVSDTAGYAYDGIYVICEFGGHLEALESNASITVIMKRLQK
jgi:hypothetical protein